MLPSTTDKLLWIKIVIIKDTHWYGSLADLVFIWITDRGHVNPEYIYLVLNAIIFSGTERKEKFALLFHSKWGTLSVQGNAM